MRHLGSIALAIVLTPLLYVLAGIGEVKFETNAIKTAGGAGNDWTAIGIGVAAIVIAGGLFAILAMVRLSPLGPLLAALALVGATVWGLLKPNSLIKLIGHSVFGIQGAAEAPLTGLALLLAVPLVVTIVSPRRWRGHDKAAVAAYVPTSGAAPLYGDSGYAQPTYPVPTSAAPTYVPTPNASAPTQVTPESAADSQAVVEVPGDSTVVDPDELTQVDEPSKDE